MVDNRGPGKHNILKCNTLGLADLGDLVGFDANGVEDTLYALHLKDGIYNRKEVVIPTADVGDKTPPTFVGLGDTLITGVDVNKKYALILGDDGKWKMVPSDTQWSLNISLTSPYVMMRAEGANIIAKIINKGVLLASYVPSKSKGCVLKLLSGKEGYALTNRNHGSPAHISLQTEFPKELNDLRNVPSNSSIYLELLLGEIPTGFIEMLEGIKIKWPQKDKNKIYKVWVNTAGKLTSNLEDVSLVVEGPINLTKINVWDNLSLIRMMYTTHTLSTLSMKIISNE